MKLIRIIIRVHPSNYEFELVVPASVTVNNLLDYLKRNSFVEGEDFEGNRINYALVPKGRNINLEDFSFLSQAGVQNGDVLLAMPIFVAGGPGEVDTIQGQRQRFSPELGSHYYYPRGKIWFDLPSKMEIGEAHRCTVRIANDYLKNEIISAGLSEDTKDARIQIGKVMKVILQENAIVENLVIKPLADEEQIVEEVGEMYTEWLFDVIPTRIGPSILFLKVSLLDHLKDLGIKAKTVFCYDLEVLIYKNRTEEFVDDYEGYFEFTDIDALTKFDKEKKDKIIGYIVNNETGQALSILANILQDKDLKLFQNIIVLQAKWNESVNQVMLGLIPTTEWLMIQSQVNYATLEVVHDLELGNFSDKKRIQKRRRSVKKAEELFDRK